MARAMHPRMSKHGSEAMEKSTRCSLSRRKVLEGSATIVLLRASPSWAFGLGGKPAQNSAASEYERMMEQMKSSSSDSGSEVLSAESMYSPCPDGYELKMRKSVSSAQCIKVGGSEEDEPSSQTTNESTSETTESEDPEDGYIVNGVRITFALE